MPRRAIPADPSIAERIKVRREMRRWSIRFAAQRAGISHSTWSRIEHGLVRTDRYMISDLAAALECSVADLTGQPHVPGDRALETAHARVEAIWRALLEIAPDEPPARPVLPLPELTARFRLLGDRRRACDYAGAGQLLPDLLLDLHSAAAGPDTRATMLMLVQTTYAATFTLRHLGYVAECALAAERCRQTAERLGEPVPLAVADWVRSHAAIAGGAFGRSLSLISRATGDLERHLTDDTALEVLGMMHLTAAMSVMAERRTDDAFEHLRQAAELAARTGESDSWSMSFGPTNVGIWRVGIEVDAGQPGRAVETASGLNVSAIPVVSRQSTFYVEFARALGDLAGRRDREAIRMLLTAERLAPQRIRSSVAAKETARFLLDRARRMAGGSELIGLCERLGVQN